MRILSKQHDYYDHAMGYGIDHTVVYIRKLRKEDINKELSKILIPDDRTWWNFPRCFIGFTLVVAGIVHRGLMHFPDGTYIRETGNFYRVQGKAKYLESAYSSIPKSTTFHYSYTSEVVHHIDMYTKGAWRSKWVQTSRFYAEIQRYFNYPKDQYREYFLNHKIPLLCWSERSRNIIVYDFLLREFDFKQVMRSDIVFQELAMFLGAIKDPAQTVQIADKDLISEHGYTEKSFRHPYRVKDLE